MFMHNVGSTFQMAEALHFPTKMQSWSSISGRHIQEEQCWDHAGILSPALAGSSTGECSAPATGRTSQWSAGTETGSLQTLWRVLQVECGW